MKPLVLVEIAMHPKAMEELSAVCRVTTHSEERSACDAIITYTAQDAWLEDNLSNLKAVACHSYEPAFGAWAEKNGVSVDLVASLWRTVAEHTVALLMSVTRQIPAANSAVRNGEWNNHNDLKVRFSGQDFQHKTLGIWGLGQIGFEVARMVQGFETDVLYTDVLPLPEHLQQQITAKPCSLDELLARSDYFIVMVPLDKTTRDSFGAAEFAKMKRGAILINTARAGIINEAAFDAALSDGTLAAAAIDVTWEEPMAKENPLLRHDNLLVTPHLGGSTYDCDMVLVDAVLRTIA